MTDRETEQVTQFVGKLAELSARLGEIFQSGDVGIVGKMHPVVKEMYRLQHGSDIQAFEMIDADCEIIYKNFDMMLAVLRTAEDDSDSGALSAAGKFLHNINEAVVNIASTFGLV